MHPREWDNRRCRVLYVQDSAPDRHLVQELLQTNAHSDVAFMGVVCTSDAMEEIYQSGRQAPNLVLLGWSPHSDTLLVLHGLKRDQKLCVVPVVVLGSQMQTIDITRMYDENASCVIALPQGFTELERVFAVIKEFWLNHARLPKGG